MTIELRCPNKLHATVPKDGVIEVRCRSVFCGWKSGIVVLHRFDVHTGQCTTQRFKDPGKKVNHATDQHSASVRAS